MKKILLGVAIGLGLLIPFLAFGQSNPNFWLPNIFGGTTYLKPLNATWGLQVPQLGAGGSPCLTVDASGHISTQSCSGSTSSITGTGQTGFAAYWTSASNLGTSTIVQSLLSTTTAGGVSFSSATGTNITGVLNSLNISQFTNNSSYATTGALSAYQPLLSFPLAYGSTTHLGAGAGISISGQNIVNTGITSVNSATGTYYIVAGTNITISTTTTSTVVNCSNCIVSNAGNWAGTWQGVNSSTFYLASNPSGYISGNQNITLSGDTSGSGATSVAVTVTGLQGKSVTSTAPATSSVLSWDGTYWKGVATSTLGLQSVISFPLAYGSTTHLGAGAGISISGQNIVNTGVTSFNGATGTITGVNSVNGATGTVTFAYIATNTGNWAGTWQGVNSSTFYLASNPSGYISAAPATTTIKVSTTTLTGPSFILSTSTAAGRWDIAASGSNQFVFYLPPSGDAWFAPSTTIPTNNNQLTNGAGYITAAPATTTIKVSTTTLTGPSFILSTSTSANTWNIAASGTNQFVFTIPPANDAYFAPSTTIPTSFSTIATTTPFTNQNLAVASSGKIATVSLGLGLSITNQTVNVSSSLATSTLGSFSIASNTGNATPFLVQFPANHVFSKIVCGDQTAGTSTFTFGIYGGIASTTTNSIIATGTAGTAGVTLTSFTSSTISAGQYFGVTSTVSGTPTITNCSVISTIQ